MENWRDHFEEIKAILTSSNTKSQKPYAYSTLSRLQELATTDSTSIQLLADSAEAVVSSIVTDIPDDDEEIAAQALKCLGFTIYHPSIVKAITGDNVSIIIDSLVKVITTTRNKSVCNLGVWCISIQQFSLTTLEAHFHPLLRAIAHALDNPMGSLSITFEATQAVMKLATLLGGKMREMSNLWAPPIYRRLVRVDKREREISERCLLKIWSIIYPAPVALSKALLSDLKKKLLSTMEELLNRGMKIQTIQAWGWFIRFVGSFAMKNKHLVNEMLKLPEQTFSDFDPQVQIASLVAWEGLIDALILPPIQASEGDAVPKHGTQPIAISKENTSHTEAARFSKGIKLIMTPLIGIMSSKCDISVHMACLNTWSYLLHKLDTSISCAFVIKSVWEPVFEIVFQVGPDNRTVWLWNVCLDLLNAFTSARSADANNDPNNQQTAKLSDNCSVVGPPESGQCSWKNYPIKWSPWELNQLEFFIKMVHIVISQGSNQSVCNEYRMLAQNAALRLFRSLLRAVQAALKCISTTYDEVMLCLASILRFLKTVCENVTSEDSNVIDLHHASLQLLEMVTEEIESSTLESPLYKVTLDLNFLDKLDLVGKARAAIAPDIGFLSNKDMVSPVVHLSVLYFSVAENFTSKTSDFNSILNRMYRHVKLLLSSYDPLDILHVFIGMLYKYEAFRCLGIWKTLANCLKSHMDVRNNHLLVKMERNNRGRSLAVHLLAYPFAVCSYHKIQLELQDLIEVWKLLYISVNHTSQHECSSQKSFSEDLSSILSKFLDDITINVDATTEIHPREKNPDDNILLLGGSVVTCVLEQFLSRVCLKRGQTNDDDKGTFSDVKSSLGLAARFMNLACEREETVASMVHSVTSRVFATLIRYVDSLRSRDDIVAFSKIMTTPLLKWLSLVEVNNEKTNNQLQQLWTKILNSLRRSQPSIKFDSSFLRFQGSLLEKTLDHQNIGISEPAVNFWNSTYGGQLELEYPENLLPVLDKLTRNGKIKICRRNLAIKERKCSGVNSTVAPQIHRVTATLTNCSKRVELMKDAMDDSKGKNKSNLSSKRKRPELTEHQKEVRRAQQGRARDCSGHGPGIRTYTSVDFSQGNEESQESQDIRDADSILEMLRKEIGSEELPHFPSSRPGSLGEEL